ASADGAGLEWLGSGVLKVSAVALRMADSSSAADVVRSSNGTVILKNVRVSGGVAGPDPDQASGAGLRFEAMAEGVIRGSQIVGNAGWGLVASGNSTLQIEDTELSANAGGGAWLGERSST